ncbi:acetyl-CoA hydrolase/transferase family protein [Alkaliphilus serpentinus]|uniref:Acetyl-CoA hydrolase/transferase family protein n=1 Tax=Alkaliphilus serpentinus TaxID=1482731 RepID=A0A833MBL4_9FIRM|nr:acetyl-CoA hydrolase/transferase family protein [Alkaliphilus serpentinus]KAB3533790.1 acetyl-CoA hydrolase/transferase family protein [Alkaliphilus serpentinus]
MNRKIRLEYLKRKIMTAADAASLIKNGMTVATSGFTPSGYPKAVPLALAKRAEEGEEIKINLITGASVGDELDGALSRSNVIDKRYPYQTNDSLRNRINDGLIGFQDLHLSHVPQMLDYGFFGKIDMAIVEALAITEEGGIIPTTSVGLTPQAINNAEGIIIEINTAQPKELEGIHDIYITEKPPNRRPIPILHPKDRIGTTSIPCDISKIKAIIYTDIPDNVRPLGGIDEASKRISEYIIDFFNFEVKQGRLPKELLPLQSGVGSIANAVLGGLVDSKFYNLTCYTEVIQDSMFDLIDEGKVLMASGTALTPSIEGFKRLYDRMDFYRKHCILRPMEISNHPEVIRRLGVIAMNTAIEADIYGHVNSTMIAGSRMMNGIGGSGDFTRNGYFSIFTTHSTAKGGNISSIVPKVAHVDHTEHDVSVIVTEQGLADLRGTSPRERARKIIRNCAHPQYRDLLYDYLERAEKGFYRHQPQIIHEALSWHTRYLNTGSMKK